jgi:hypothetical protein
MNHDVDITHLSLRRTESATEVRSDSNGHPLLQHRRMRSEPHTTHAPPSRHHRVVLRLYHDTTQVLRSTVTFTIPELVDTLRPYVTWRGSERFRHGDVIRIECVYQQSDIESELWSMFFSLVKMDTLRTELVVQVSAQVTFHVYMLTPNMIELRLIRVHCDKLLSMLHRYTLSQKLPVVHR